MEDFLLTLKHLTKYAYLREEWNFLTKDLSATCYGQTLKTLRLGHFLQEVRVGSLVLRSQMNSVTSMI